ncbi:hypothetical protein [Ohtaekwangia kribbensis]|jgi:membrane-anchored glycerophosphoryl diester phosphodiesterase (GDPDase)
MTAKTIGRKILLKYAIFSVVTISLLLTVNLLIFGQDNVQITLGRVLSTFGEAFVEDLDFVAIQTILTLVTIWYAGGLCGQLIIEKRKNKFIIGGLATLTLWISLFIGSTFTAVVIHSVKYAGHGTESVILNWIIYGLVPLLILGLIHGLLIGFPVGHEIKKSGDKLNALQQNV